MDGLIQVALAAIALAAAAIALLRTRNGKAAAMAPDSLYTTAWWRTVEKGLANLDLVAQETRTLRIAFQEHTHEDAAAITDMRETLRRIEQALKERP